MKMSLEGRESVREKIKEATGFERFLFIGITNDAVEAHLIGNEVSPQQIKKIGIWLIEATIDDMEIDPT